jgi:ADP-heptose:LPS heptosyltransferase
MSLITNQVLIIKLGALGDIVMATALIKGIVDKHKSSRCTLLTTDKYREVFINWNNLLIKTFPRHGLIHNARTLNWMRHQKFTHLYDLQGSNRTRIMSRFSNIPVRVGNLQHPAYTHCPKEPWLGKIHIFNRMIEVCNSSGVDIQYKLPYFPKNTAEVKKIENWLEKTMLTGKDIVLLHAGVSPKRPEKQWPYFPELATYLIQRNIVPVWIGGEPDRELNSMLSSVAGIDATAEFSASELSQLSNFAKFAVTNDSGPMHILSSGNIPIFGIFGPSDWVRNHALGQEKYVITLDKLSTTGPKGTNLSELTPSHVITFIEKTIF